ncbi:hypothetical protein EVAR_95094_1 [Eumeta japonica]|uniref:DUF4817 domain-containing protein n=1 Tax=Eumeta variegata TaxID=151549 RepID=A0A4C1W7X9_EUMVA|nr:hypothetical protein EVAR_95094_1 [Eumeta japonica]
MVAFTNVEYVNIIYKYGIADINANLARRMYEKRFPMRRLPNVQVFMNTYRRIHENGTDTTPKKKKVKGEIKEEIEQTVVEDTNNTATPSGKKKKKKIAESTDGAEDTQEIDTIETEPTSEKKKKKKKSLDPNHSAPEATLEIDMGENRKKKKKKTSENAE